ncbi:hypothetical protein ARMGADRAFT_1034114 [Armillaria gallica]|uniref:XPG-I domain-containing protein n=1 Tax=Armillaria gallica TaxID=47427 RepID=A0A2H3D326_ARMGA|nr:hypothetical protein ARMGADRAFT_1034114 [Armillaria gallica]
MAVSSYYSLLELLPPLSLAMGIPNLWQTILGIAQPCVLTEYAAIEVFGLCNVKLYSGVHNMLKQCTLILVFGFDGQLCLSIKCGKKAPGEAEAELAQMNQAGLIDTIITEDSDVLEFLFLCVLADRCGQKTAHAFCQTSLGNKLFTAVTIMGPTALDNFLIGWQTRLQSELINPMIPGVSRHPALANKLPDDFPNPQILRLYALPVTSWSGEHALPNAILWKPPLPDIACITTFCDKFFHWESYIWLKHLRKNIWPGIIIHSLYRMTLGASKSLSEDRKMNIKVPANILYDVLPIIIEKFHECRLQLPQPSLQHQTTIALNDATATSTSNEVAEDIANAAHKTTMTREDARNVVSAGKVIDLTMSNSDEGEANTEGTVIVLTDSNSESNSDIEIVGYCLFIDLFDV